MPSHAYSLSKASTSAAVSLGTIARTRALSCAAVGRGVADCSSHYSAAIGVVVNLIRGIVGLVFGVAVIGGLGWLILRIIGRKPLTGSHHESLP